MGGTPRKPCGLGGNPKWAQDHAPGAKPAPEPEPAQPISPANPEAAAIDKEEQHARARTPDVSPGLRLPDQDGIWALDTFRDSPELVALPQNSASVDRQTGHNVLRSALNPIGGIQQKVQIPGAESKVKLHINDPAFYVSIIGVDDNEAESSAVTVDTHGAGSIKDKNSTVPQTASTPSCACAAISKRIIAWSATSRLEWPER